MGHERARAGVDCEGGAGSGAEHRVDGAGILEGQRRSGSITDGVRSLAQESGGVEQVSIYHRGAVMTYEEFRKVGGAGALTPDGEIALLHTRASMNGAHQPVVDIFRPGHGALNVCLNCGVTWDEGGSTGISCQ